MNKKAEELLLQHFQKEYGMYDDWKLSDFFPDNELKATLAAMESYASQSKEVVDEDWDRDKLNDEFIRIVGNGGKLGDFKHIYFQYGAEWAWKYLLSKVSVGGMKWIKASERMPEKQGWYFVNKKPYSREFTLKCVELFIAEKGKEQWEDVDEWLDETPISSVGSEDQSKKGIEDVTRVEVIDEKGRSYVNWKDSNKVILSYQDEGKTLKIFIK